MLTVLPALVMAPLLVGCATLVSRRWGAGAGGLVSALPAVVGPVLLITAHFQGVASAARAANGTLLGLAGLAAFAVVYGRVALRARWPVSLTAGWLAAVVLAPAVGWLAGGLGFPAGLVIAIVSLTAGYFAMPQPRDEAPVPVLTPVRPRVDVPLRMAVTTALVGTLALAASVFGPLVGGILTALPALASVLAAFTHRRDGPAMVVTLLRGMLSGLFGFVSFCAVLALLIVRLGATTAFVTAAASAVAVQVVVLVYTRRVPQRA